MEPDVLDRMTDAMTHRGPNDRGTYSAPGIALGARRLSIVDVVGGHQPVANEDETIWAVQNGELYNHEQLRGELEGHRFRSLRRSTSRPSPALRPGSSLRARTRRRTVDTRGTRAAPYASLVRISA